MGLDLKVRVVVKQFQIANLLFLEYDYGLSHNSVVKCGTGTEWLYYAYQFGELISYLFTFSSIFGNLLSFVLFWKILKNSKNAGL